MKENTNEKGQALIIIAFAAVILLGFTALAIDGTRAFEDKRHAQNAADTAALAGALAYQRDQDITAAAQNLATQNGYDDNGTTNDVTITVTDITSGSDVCPGKAAGKEITVAIDSTINTTFGRVLGRNTMSSSVTAVSHACEQVVFDPFGGAAVAGLNPSNSQCSFDSGNSNSAHWTLKNSGIFSNGCAYSKNNNSVTLDPGECIEAVGTASNFSCQQQNQTSSIIPYPDGILSMMPDNPCDGDPGDVGLTPAANQTSFTNGVYCISDFDDLDGEDVFLSNATLYVTDLNFDLKFAGGGGFEGTPTLSGTYAGYYLIVALKDPPCPDFTSNNTQSMVLRGGSGGTFAGTILAPSACVDVRGNGEPAGIATQIIGYNVSSNGDGEIYLNYSPNPDLLEPYEPTVSLQK